MMIDPFVLDSNILIYGLDPSSIYHEKVRPLFDPVNPIVITTKNISELFAVGSKGGLSFETINTFYKDLKELATIIFPNKESLEILELLIEKYRPVGNWVYDLEMVSIMLAAGVNTLATVNIKHFKNIDEIKLIKFL